MTEAEELDRAGEKLTDRATRMSGQLGNWTMAANAGGIAFVLTTARSAPGCETLALGVPYVAFLVGLVAGFLGQLLLLGAMADGAIMTATASNEAASRAALRERAKVPGSITAEMEIDDLQEPVRVKISPGFKWFALWGVGAYVVAAACAVTGLIYPLASGAV